MFLDSEERKKVLRLVWRTALPGKKIIVGTGCESTRETLSLCAVAAEAGADACLVVNPSYYSSAMKEEILFEHYAAVADGADIPVLLYNVPKFTGINLAPALIERLSKHPNIWGLKDSSGNIAQLTDILGRVDGDFSVLVGTAGVFLSAGLMGAAGGVLALANIAPKNCLRILDYLREGDIEKARVLQKKMAVVNNAVTTVYGIPGLKCAMDLLGYLGGFPRRPLRPLTKKERKNLEKILRLNGLPEE